MPIVQRFNVADRHQKIALVQLLSRFVDDFRPEQQPVRRGIAGSEGQKPVSVWDPSDLRTALPRGPITAAIAVFGSRP